MPLTVLSVNYPFAPVSPETAGGAEQVLAMLDRALVETGHTSLVLAPGGSRCRGKLLAMPAVPSRIDYETREIAYREYRRAIRGLMTRTEIDVIHFHGLDCLEYLTQAGPPLVLTLHLRPQCYPRELFRRCEHEIHLVCVSQSQARHCPPGAATTVIENGVKLDEYYPEERKEDYAVALGRMCPEKAFHIALDAARTAGMRLLLAGETFGYSAHQHYFREFILPRCNLDQQFLGPVSGERKRILLARAQCVLVPSLVPETSSLVAMEALACGTPVIAFPAGALPDIIEHGRTGFIVEDEEAMAAAIPQTAELEPAECRRAAENRFSADRMVQQYLDLYSSLTRTNLPAPMGS